MKELSMLLEKLAEKYPDEQLVMDAQDLMAGEEDMMVGEEEMDMGLEDEVMGEVEAAPAFDDLFAEDMADEEDEDMPPKKKKKKKGDESGVDEPIPTLGSI